VHHPSHGPNFGCGSLLIEGERMNEPEAGTCLIAGSDGGAIEYMVEADKQGRSMLTGEKNAFTCREVEVYQIIL
jgi:hypothetical protein